MSILRQAICHLHEEETALAEAYRAVADRHPAELTLGHTCRRFADQCAARAEGLRPFAERHGAHLPGTTLRRLRGQVLAPVRRLAGGALTRTRLSGLMLLVDLRQILAMTHRSAMDWVLLGESGHAAHDPDLRAHAGSAQPEKELQIRWARARIRQLAPQPLVFS